MAARFAGSSSATAVAANSSTLMTTSASAQATWEQISAIIGHPTIKMTKMYTERAERGSEAIPLLERTR